MPDIHHLCHDPAEDERRRERLEDDEDEESALQARLERAAEHASLRYSHLAIHRLARRERARRTALADGRAAA